MVQIGTEENRIADLVSRQECEKAEAVVHEIGCNHQWIYIVASMQRWEYKLQKWDGEHETLDASGDVDEDMERETREAEHLAIDISHRPH